MAQLADPTITKRERSRLQLLRMGLLRDGDGKRLVPLDMNEVAKRLMARQQKEEKDASER